MSDVLPPSSSHPTPSVAPTAKALLRTPGCAASPALAQLANKIESTLRVPNAGE